VKPVYEQYYAIMTYLHIPPTKHMHSKTITRSIHIGAHNNKTLNTTSSPTNTSNWFVWRHHGSEHQLTFHVLRTFVASDTNAFRNEN